MTPEQPMAVRMDTRDQGEHQWWRDAPRRVSIGPVKFVVPFLVLAYWAWTLSYAGAFLLGLFVIAVLRHNARAAGSRGGWRVWSIAWVLTWTALGALALALGGAGGLATWRSGWRSSP